MAVKSDREIKKIIKEYTNKLLRAGIPVEKIVLFGSYALNKANEDSDIDIAVVVKKMENDRFTIRLKLMKYCRDFEEVIEPHPFLSDEFNDDNPFASEIIRNGVVIYS